MAIIERLRSRGAPEEPTSDLQWLQSQFVDPMMPCSKSLWMFYDLWECRWLTWNLTGCFYSLSTMSLWTVAALNSTRNLQGPCNITFGVSSDWFLIISSPLILKWSVKHIIKPMFDSHGPWQMSTLDPRPRIGSIGSSPIRSFLGILVNRSALKLSCFV